MEDRTDFLIDQKQNCRYQNPLDQIKRCHCKDHKSCNSVNCRIQCMPYLSNRIKRHSKCCSIGRKQDIGIEHASAPRHEYCSCCKSDHRSLFCVHLLINQTRRHTETASDQEVCDLSYTACCSPINHEIQKNLDTFCHNSRHRTHRKCSKKDRNFTDIQFVKARYKRKRKFKKHQDGSYRCKHADLGHRSDFRTASSSYLCVFLRVFHVSSLLFLNDRLNSEKKLFLP